jgi:hypothetical protein
MSTLVARSARRSSIWLCACNQPELAEHKLSVFGACGCTLFELRAGLAPEVEQPVPAT